MLNTYLCFSPAANSLWGVINSVVPFSTIFESDTEKYSSTTLEDEGIKFDANKKLNIDLNKLKVFRGFNPEKLSSKGIASNGIVLIDPLYDFSKIDHEGLNFLIKHEIGHLDHNDNANVYYSSALISLVASVAVFLFSSMNIYWAAVPLILNFAAGIIGVRKCEWAADNFAISNATNEELLGGVRFFTAIAQAQSEQYKLGHYFKYTSEGDNRFSAHPSFKDRIKNIQNEIKKRNIQFDASNSIHTDKVNQLRDFFMKSF